MGLEVQRRKKRGRPRLHRKEGSHWKYRGGRREVGLRYIGRRAVGLEVQGRKKRGRPKTT